MKQISHHIFKWHRKKFVLSPLGKNLADVHEISLRIPDRHLRGSLAQLATSRIYTLRREILLFISIFASSADAAEIATDGVSWHSFLIPWPSREAPTSPSSSPEASIFACKSFHSSRRSWASNWLMALDSSSSSWLSFLKVRGGKRNVLIMVNLSSLVPSAPWRDLIFKANFQ